MLPVAKLDYVLPERLVATEPAEPRDSARLMVLRRSDPRFVHHVHVRDIPEFLSAGDLMVVNTSRVIPACLHGTRADTGGKVEGLFLSAEAVPPVAIELPAAGAAAVPFGYQPRGGEHWRVMLKGRRMRPGIFVGLTDPAGKPAGVSLKLVSKTTAAMGPADERPEGDADGEEQGAWLVEVFACGFEASAHKQGELPVALLERIGTTPLPPYIRSARRRADGTYGEHDGERNIPAHELAERDALDRARYQTVYADASAAGSVAAPTAGLHFTSELLEKLAAAGVRRQSVVLHVGTGTFKPVETEFVEQHPMHAEWCTLPKETGAAILGTRAAGGRVIAVGTTAARTLESFPSEQLTTGAAAWTRLLVTPGWQYRHLDGMMTNFHLPRSTLLAMVGALLPEGIDRLLGHYQDAIDRGYRFYSYGDAMLILP